MLQNEGTNDKRRRSPRLKTLEEKREKEAREKIIGKVEEEKEVQEQVNNQQQQQAACNEDEEKDKEERIEKVEEEAEAEQVNQQQQRAGKLKTYVDCEKKKIQFFAGSRKKEKRTRRIVDILNNPTSPETQHTDHSTTSSKKDKDMAPEISRRDTYFFSNDYKPPLYSTALLLDDAQKDLQYNEEAGSGSYEESLLRFTRGLGPVAQRVAAQKLEALKRFQLLKISDDELKDHELPAAPTPEQEEEDVFINKEAKADVVSSPEEP
ncbi:hypothetical protein RIF29_06435 [Crotalaria pallida]|uniref:Uncharacterized protein n=1 Tax=Crotalaria pallida TaxID=3830 RepID=A0AAN9J494_CROPI